MTASSQAPREETEAGTTGGRLMLPLNPGYLGAFLLLTYLLGRGHELAHLVTARLVCGAWGMIDLMNFKLPEGCHYGEDPAAHVAGAAGPALNYLVMIVGALVLRRSRDLALLGFTLVFAALPAGRLLTIFGSGDEPILGRFLFGDGGTWVMRALGLAIMMPALWVAYRAIENRTPLLIVAAFLLLPLLVLGPLILTINPALERATVRFWGVPVVLIVVDLAALAGLVALRRFLKPEPPPAPRPDLAIV